MIAASRSPREPFLLISSFCTPLLPRPIRCDRLPAFQTSVDPLVRSDGKTRTWRSHSGYADSGALPARAAIRGRLTRSTRSQAHGEGSPGYAAACSRLKAQRTCGDRRVRPVHNFPSNTYTTPSVASMASLRLRNVVDRSSPSAIARAISGFSHRTRGVRALSCAPVLVPCAASEAHATATRSRQRGGAFGIGAMTCANRRCPYGEHQ